MEETKDTMCLVCDNPFVEKSKGFGRTSLQAKCSGDAKHWSVYDACQSIFSVDMTPFKQEQRHR